MIFFSHSTLQSSSSEFVPNNNIFFRGSSFEFNTFSDSEVYNTIMSIKSNVVGPDGIHLKFVKIILPFILTYTAHIFNHIVTTASFPQKWQKSVVKKTSPADPANYMPVNILSALFNAFERLICNQIVTHMRNNKLLSEHQSGFQKL